ncbi:helix-turn-helix transcriptional regulator [Methanosarcina sp. Mfa9]|uniref:helix-turn-helix transcriptional regulator n=1 Tax=Methanosarcina sp. Mfa9 TaxID=3439063 RepID=UPI003F82E5DC
MKSELMDMVFLSEKRKNLLLFLKSGPKNIDEIKEILQVSSTSILPQIKKLKEQKLVLQEDKTYELAPIGKVLVEKMEPIVSTLELFEENFEYWAERDLCGIPPELRKRLWELGKCKLIRPDLERMFEFDPEFMDNLNRADHIFESIAYFHPALITLCRDIANKGVEISLLVAEPVLQRCIDDYREDLLHFLSRENVTLFLYSGELRIASLTVTDDSMNLSLFSRKRHFDGESLVSYDSSSLKWGMELFKHLLKNAEQITEIPEGTPDKVPAENSG